MIGDGDRSIGVITFPDDGRLISSGVQMPVNTIVGDIQLTVFKPANMNVILRKTRILHLGKRFGPVQAHGFAPPECFTVLDGFLVQHFIARLVDPGGKCGLWRYRVERVSFVRHAFSSQYFYVSGDVVSRRVDRRMSPSCEAMVCAGRASSKI